MYREIPSTLENNELPFGSGVTSLQTKEIICKECHKKFTIVLSYKKGKVRVKLSGQARHRKYCQICRPFVSLKIRNNRKTEVH